jgi:hypothetical protein
MRAPAVRLIEALIQCGATDGQASLDEAPARAA